MIRQVVLEVWLVLAVFLISQWLAVGVLYLIDLLRVW